MELMGLFRNRAFLFSIFSIGMLFTWNLTKAQNWPKIYSGNIHASIKEISESYDKGFYLTAFTYTFQGVNQFGWIIKIDINGNILWDKKFGIGNDRNWFGDSFLTNDQGLIISGVTTKYSAGDFDPAFIKLNVCGEAEWCKVFQSPDQNYGTGILQLSDGSYIGMLEYYGEGEAYSRISLVKMDQAGEPVWINQLAQEDTLIYNEEGAYLYLTTDNNYLVSGWAYHPASYPFWIMTDTIGEQIWDLFGDNFLGEAHQVIEMDSGIFYSTSYAIGNNGIQSPVLFKFDKYGSLIGEYYLMGDTIIMGSCVPIASLDDSTLIIGVGWKEVPFPIDEGFTEIFITDTMGILKNRRQLFEDEYSSCQNIIVSSDHKILATGTFAVTGNMDIYLWKMNTNLEDDTLYTLPLTYDSLCPYEIQSDTVDIDCGVFVNVEELPTKEEYESTIMISPNPAKDWVVLTLPDVLAGGKVELVVYDIFGREAGRRGKGNVIPFNRMISLDVLGFSPGMYVVVVVDRKGKKYTGKFVVAR
jgi:hypothetical protein